MSVIILHFLLSFYKKEGKKENKSVSVREKVNERERLRDLTMKPSSFVYQTLVIEESIASFLPRLSFRD